MSTNQKFSLMRIMAVMGCLVFLSIAGVAQASRPSMRIIVTSGPATAIDSTGRIIQEVFGEALSQATFIDNIPGGGTMIGTRAIAKAAPDGNTVGIIASNFAILPSAHKALPYDSIEDITPIAIIGTVPLVLVASPDLPISNAQELAAHLRVSNGKGNYASPGIGSAQHLMAKAFLDATKAEAVHIPYKSTSGLLTDIAAGERVDFGVAALSAAAPLIISGKLRAVGMLGEQRDSTMMDVPTLKEQGFTDVVFDAWIAMIAPGKLPAEEVHRIHGALSKAIASPAVRLALENQQMLVKLSSQDEAVTFIRSELDRYSRLAKDAGIIPQ
ncbi:MAG: Bug family tripartite tricarboxylate transporter substrate binding protein [Burkholderiaceae bacterium]